MRTVLVTGATGYLGGRLAAALAGTAGVRVRTLVRNPTADVPGHERALADLAVDPIETVVDACRGVDAVVHLAGANEALFAADPDRFMAETVAASRRLATAAVEARVGRFVYASTIHVYGSALAEGATVTEQTLPEPRFGYAIARLASEHLIAGVVSGTATDVVVLRITNVIGAPLDPAVDRWTLLANDLCRQAAVDGELRLRTHGYQWRDFMVMDDFFDAMTACVRDRAIEAGTYNLGSGEPMTCRALAEMVQDAAADITGTRPPLHAPDPPSVRPDPYVVSVKRIEHMGIRVTRPVRSGVDELARFCFAHRGDL